MWYLVTAALLAVPALGARLPNVYEISYESGRIIGGSNASPGQFPYQAGIDRSGVHSCGGSILNHNHILTAAHCLQFPRLFYDIYVGQHSRNNRDANVQHLVIQTFNIHPDYTGSQSDGMRADVAIITTNPFVLNSRVQTIPLAGPNQDFTGQLCQMSGWGETGGPIGSGSYADALQFTNMRAMSRFDCEWAMPLAGISDYHVCFISDNRQSTTCLGDSGGPANCNGVLAGVTSFGVRNIFTGECSTDHPTVFASVSYYRNWILNNS